MERMYCALDEKSATRFACVRYGNVAWSTGSVLPVWQQMHSSSGVIGSTGPHMRRFFFTVDEAVALVMTALENVDQVHGRVLARHMKAAKIEDLLNAWIAHKGGRWEKIEGRPGEREDEYLIGDLELPFTRALSLNGVPHYLIGFNDRAPEPLPEGLSSANTSPLTEEEMLALIEGQQE
jgi:FlaA1/EpsC-like NDP-sugar epimerase